MKSSILIALVCLVTIGELVLARHSILHKWTQYKRKHGKVYADPAEEARRFSSFLATIQLIEQHNANQSVSYKLGLNHLADLTKEESAKLNGLRYDAEEHQQRLQASKDDPFLRSILDDQTPVPNEVDWRKVPGRVSEVKDQGYCGSCWAFATTGVLEGQQVARNLTIDHLVVPLSEQQLVDCSSLNKGCEGGIMSLALEDIRKMGGIESEQDYPYVAPKVSECHFDAKREVMIDSGSVNLPSGDEDALKKVVAKFGPVAVAIAANDKLRHYESGIFDDPDCILVGLNHGVLVVGYGTDSEHGDYWIVKNSWSSEWGENGYIRMKRGTRLCGISALSTIPKFD